MIEKVNTIIIETEISKEKGNIIICMVNKPLMRDKIIELLSKELFLRKIPIENGDEIIRILKREKNKPGIHYDAWIWIMPEKGNPDILNALNMFRELFYDITIPNLIFCNQSFLKAVIREAPDFWRYRGNYYEFEAEEEFLSIFKSNIFEPPFFYRDKEDLSRRKRIVEYLLEKTEDKDEKGDLYRELAIIHGVLGDPRKGLECLREALTIDREIENRKGEAIDLGNIGKAYQNLGSIDEALEYHKEALEINREIGYRLGEANQLGNIGLTYSDKGDLEEALKFFKEALAISKKIGYRLGEANQLGNIGLTYSDKGDLDEALKYHKKALEIHRETGYKQGEAIDLGNIGIICRKKGELAEALKYHKKALAISREMGYKQGEAIDLTNIGLTYSDKGNLEEALKYHKKALAISREIGYKLGEANNLANIGIILKLMERKNNALKFLNEASEIFDKIGAKVQADLVNHHILEIVSCNQ